MIRLEFRDLHTDPPNLSGESEAILGVVGTFELRVRDKLVYAEVDFPLVEFARACNLWLKEARVSEEDFEFESMEATEPGLVWMRREGDGWRIGSILQEYPEMTIFSINQIEAAIVDFSKRLMRDAREKLGLELFGLLKHAT